MYYLLFVIPVLFFLNGCAVSNEAKNLSLLKQKSYSLNLEYTKPVYNNTTTHCVDSSFTVFDDNQRYGKIFVEYIKLNANCDWNGFVRGYLQYEFNKKLKLDSFELVDDIDVNGYEFTTYRVNGKYYVNFIYGYYQGRDLLIVDHLGVLSKEMLSKLLPKYENQFFNKTRFESDYQYSLVRFNRFFNYFEGREKRNSPLILIPKN